MGKTLYYLILSSRPKQWLKNLSLFAALVFSGRLLIAKYFLKTLWATIVFCLLTSAIYLLNDIIDKNHDKQHPVKRLRPIASEKLPIPTAFLTSILLTFLVFLYAKSLGLFFFLACLFYFTLQIFYSLYLKTQIIFDVLTIAAGFILRVVAGAFVIDVHLSGWFYLCLISFSLFLSVGKRRAELTILAERAPRHRKTLSLYTTGLLDSYLSICGASAFLSWSLFTFFAPPPPVNQAFPFLNQLPLALAGVNKWLMTTIPLVIYGIMRYLKIIYEGTRAESPENALLNDKPLLFSVISWGILVVLIIYGIRV